MNSDIEYRLKKIKESKPAPNTIKAYEKGIKYFEKWLDIVHGLDITYPVDSNLIIEFVLSHVEGLDPDINNKMILSGIKKISGNHKISSIKQKIQSIAYFHKNYDNNPCNSKIIRDILYAGQRIEREKGIVRKQSRAITKDILAKMIGKINTREIEGLRDRAILEFAFYTGGRRRSEICAAKIELLTKVRGGYEYLLHRSKTDQLGKGFVKFLRNKNASALESWIKTGEIKSGFLFRKIKSGNVTTSPLAGKDINSIIKKLIDSIGLDAKFYSSHGLRRGFITQCGRDGIPIFDTMILTGHKDIQQAMVYYEEGCISANSATKI